MTSQLYHPIFSEMFTFREVKDDKILFDLTITGKPDTRFYFSANGNFHLSSGFHIPMRVLEESYSSEMSDYWTAFPMEREVPIEKAEKWEPPLNIGIGSFDEDDWGHYCKLEGMVTLVLMYDQTMRINLGDNQIAKFELVEIRRIVDIAKQINGIETRYPGILENLDLRDYEVSEISLEEVVLTSGANNENKLTFGFASNFSRLSVSSPNYSIPQTLKDFDTMIEILEDESKDTPLSGFGTSHLKFHNWNGSMAVVIDSVLVDTWPLEFMRFVSNTGHEIYKSWEALYQNLAGVHKNSLLKDLVEPSVVEGFLGVNYIKLSNVDQVKFYFDDEVISVVTGEDYGKARYGIKLTKKFLTYVLTLLDEENSVDHDSDLNLDAEIKLDTNMDLPENIHVSIFADNLILSRDMNSAFNIILRKSDIETLLSHKPKK